MQTLELFFGLLQLTIALKAIKFCYFPADPSLGLEDLALLAAIALAASFAPLLAAAALTIIYSVLWLDVIVFRAFTIELGTGGLGTVVLSMLYRELREVSQARRVFEEHASFNTFPLLAFAVAIRPSTLELWHDLAIALFLGVLAISTPKKCRAAALFAWTAGTSATALGHAGVELAPSTLYGAGGAFVVLTLIASIARKKTHPSFFRRFFGFGRLPSAKNFIPRAEHQSLFERSVRAQKTSEYFGRARGANAILFTVESLGRDHVACETGLTDRDAQLPFLEALIARRLSSSAHFCISPNTNDAHVALYASTHSARAGLPNLRPLHEAGYNTIYLSAIRTKDYGLRALLDSAGFRHVLDREYFGGPRDPISDYILGDRAADAIAELLAREGGPYFLHVHTTDTHIPYRVIDAEKFSRFDSTTDRGRFTNGLEEADFLIARFHAALGERGLLGDSPIVAVTGDHGQAFGELGYLSHSSAVIKEEINVPFALAHRSIEPKRIAFSSHFDVLPTIHDLLGLASDAETHGSSLLAPRDVPPLVLSAGHPSRSRSSNFGLLLGDRKYMVDLISDRCYEMTWNDEILRELEGDEKKYWTLLLHRLLIEHGLE
jgi:hypothetical protein